MKTLIISAAISLMIFAGFVFADPPPQEDNPQGGPPACEEGQPPPPPCQPMMGKGWNRGKECGEIEGKGQGGKWNKSGKEGDDMHRKMRAKMGKKIEKMRKKNPEEFERLMKLRKENPEAFRNEIHKRFKEQFKKDNPEAFKKMKKMNNMKKKINLLNQEYQKCEDADKKKEIKKQMKDLIGKTFDLTQKFREDEIDNLETKTKELRKKVRKRGKNKEEMVDLMLKGLIDGEETVKW